jgi:hypothetical protein
MTAAGGSQMPAIGTGIGRDDHFENSGQRGDYGF